MKGRKMHDQQFCHMAHPPSLSSELTITHSYSSEVPLRVCGTSGEKNSSSGFFQIFSYVGHTKIYLLVRYTNIIAPPDDAHIWVCRSFWRWAGGGGWGNNSSRTAINRPPYVIYQTALSLFSLRARTRTSSAGAAAFFPFFPFVFFSFFFVFDIAIDRSMCASLMLMCAQLHTITHTHTHRREKNGRSPFSLLSLVHPSFFFFLQHLKEKNGGEQENKKNEKNRLFISYIYIYNTHSLARAGVWCTYIYHHPGLPPPPLCIRLFLYREKMEKKERFYTDRHASIYRYGVESLYIYIHTVDIDMDLHNTASPRRCIVCMVVVVVVYRWCFEIDERLLENVSAKSFSSSSSSLLSPSLLSTLSNTAAAAAASAFIYVYLLDSKRSFLFLFRLHLLFVLDLFLSMRFGSEQQRRHRNRKLKKRKVSDITASINHVSFIGGQFNLISVWWN